MFLCLVISLWIEQKIIWVGEKGKELEEKKNDPVT
jgi:hypothetical protein